MLRNRTKMMFIYCSIISFISLICLKQSDCFTFSLLKTNSFFHLNSNNRRHQKSSNQLSQFSNSLKYNCQLVQRISSALFCEPNVQEDEEVESTSTINEIDELDNTQSNVTDSSNSTDPIKEATIAYEKSLQLEVNKLESILRTERVQLTKLKDKASESGKNGYFIVQAQVNDFLKRKTVEQKERVQQNKKEFVVKMLPVVDSFRSSREIYPPTTDREENMHKTFEALLTGVLNVFDKFGFKDFEPEVGDKLNALKHEIVHVEEADEDGIIVSTVRKGTINSDGEVIRKAQVVVTAKPSPVPLTNDNNSNDQIDDVGEEENEIINEDTNTNEE
eukprot:gene6637-9111_t